MFTPLGMKTSATMANREEKSTSYFQTRGGEPSTFSFCNHLYHVLYIKKLLGKERFISLSRFSCSRPFHLFDLINLTCVCNVYTEYGEYLENINQTKYIYAISFIATTSRRKLI